MGNHTHTLNHLKNFTSIFNSRCAIPQKCIILNSKIVFVDKSLKLPKLKGNTLSELFQLRDSAEKLSDLLAAPGMVTSSCAGSGFSLRISPLGEAGGAELDLDPAG